MIRIHVSDLKRGMVLARSVCNQQDQLLLEKGTSLTKKRILMLKTWGIGVVSVKGRAPREEPADYEVEYETRESIEKELQAKFADVIQDPIMQEIMKAASRQLQKSLTDPNK